MNKLVLREIADKYYNQLNDMLNDLAYKCTGGEEYDCSNCYESKVAKPGCTISSCNSGKNGDTSCRYRCCTTKKCKTEVKCTTVCKSGYYPCTSYNKICDEYNCIGGYK